MLEELKHIEIDFEKAYGISFGDYYEQNENKLERVGNSYNWGGAVVFEYVEFEYDDINYVAISYHFSGDVRGNYSQWVVYESEDLYTLLEEIQKGISFNIEHYEITVDTQGLWTEDGSVLIEYKSHLKGIGYGQIETWLSCDLENLEEIKDEVYNKIVEDVYKRTMRG